MSVFGSGSEKPVRDSGEPESNEDPHIVESTSTVGPERGSIEWHRSQGHLVGQEVPGER